jgi:hypothetical protein
MSQLNRKQAEALYQLFTEFALEDQRRYYRATIAKCRAAAQQVNVLRATFALLTGLASALAGLLVATSANSPAAQTITVVLVIIAVIAPVIGGAFGTLADLYQWDRLVTVYEGALANIEVADALSPDAEEPDDRYNAALQAYAEGTLSIMRDESAQWGQLIRPPRQIQEFLEAAEKRVNTVNQQFSTSRSEGSSTASGTGTSSTTPTGSSGNVTPQG